MDDDDLLARLKVVYRHSEAGFRRQYDRSLPFGDAILGNRWERAKALGFGEGASIYDSAIVFGTVHVGDHTWIGPAVILDGSGGELSIGRWCALSAGVHVYTHDTILRSLSGGVAPLFQRPVRIGDYCQLGPHAVVLAGISIGSMCLVAAHSVVNRDVPDRTIVGGTPARALGRVEGEGSSVRLVFDRRTD